MYCKNPNKNPTFNRCSLQLQSLEDVMVRSDQRTQKRSLSPVFCLSEFSGHFLWSLIFFATFPAQHWNPLEVQGRLCSPWENCSFLCNPDVWFKILLYFFFFYPQSPLAQRDISEGFTALWSENSISFPRELVQFRKFCLLCVLRCSTFYIMGITNHQQRFLVLWDPESSVNTQRTAVSRLRSFIISSKSAVEKIQIWCYSVWWCYPWNSQHVLHLTSLTHVAQSELGHVEKKSDVCKLSGE